jgi:predicted nucleotidyltransferase component of viral defense system
VKQGTKNVVASVLARLRNEAAAQGAPFNQVLQLYVIERFLYRLSKSRHVDGVVLKGALLLKTVGLPRARPTMDIDLLRQGKADRETLVALVVDCAQIVDASDGLTFDPASVVTEEIAKDAKYKGTRVQISARMDNVRLSVQIDFGVGDVVVPSPRFIEYPSFLDQPTVRLRAYPIEAAMAEKFQAMVELDVANSRMKDFYDIWACSRHLAFDGAVFANSLTATFERRGTPLPVDVPTSLTAQYFESEARQRQWQAFVRRIGEPELAGQFADVVGKVAAFVMPPAIAAGQAEAFRSRWPAGGPWGG